MRDLRRRITSARIDALHLSARAALCGARGLRHAAAFALVAHAFLADRVVGALLARSRRHIDRISSEVE